MWKLKFSKILASKPTSSIRTVGALNIFFEKFLHKIFQVSLAVRIFNKFLLQLDFISTMEEDDEISYNRDENFEEYCTEGQ